MTIELIDIIWGVIAASVVIFVRNAHVSAHQQKIAAIRLKSYLHYWKNQVMEKDFFKIFNLGMEWNEEFGKAVARGLSDKELLEFDTKKKESMLLEIRAMVDSISPEKVRELINTLKGMPKHAFDNISADVASAAQNLIDGKTFVSDQEACCLDFHSANVCIDLKMNLVELILSFPVLMLRMVNGEQNFEIKNHRLEIINLLWKCVVVSKDIDVLSGLVERYLNKSIFRLTFNNIFSTR